MIMTGMFKYVGRMYASGVENGNVSPVHKKGHKTN
jgi:hypothetical protein